jgi:isopenicillin N synthase-like dioxygenase
MEGLASHADWSLVTAIPVSPTPGLHVWNPGIDNIGGWISPEEILLSIHGRNDNHRLDIESSSKYCVVMAGKWIELLTKQKVLSCIHRVVDNKRINADNSSGRLSAPFFLRPTADMAARLHKFYNDSDSINLNMDSTVSEAVEHIHQIFEVEA